MSRTKRWTFSGVENAVVDVTLSSWRWFMDLVNQELLRETSLLFRGQASDRWKLESSIDRGLKRLPLERRESARREHLQNFKLAARGRRGPNPANLPTEDEWWALGQHHGLATPLLDFTESPFVALYFAFAEIGTDSANHRAVWAFASGALPELKKVHKDVGIVRPLSDENARLVSQRGLFVRCPAGTALDDAVRTAYAGKSEESALVRIRIPNDERTRCLTFLNRMNINHLSLFPDLSGAGAHCNNQLVIKYY